VQLDWTRARQLVQRPVLVDGRNCLEPGEIARLGYRYHAIGRPPAGAERGSYQPAEIALSPLTST
jgi:UDPglucose 6-dehydrogenase